MAELRTLVVGCGKFCRDCLAGILEHGAFRVAAVADPDAALRDAVGELAGVESRMRFASDLDAYRQARFDFAFVFSPVGAHAANCRAALEAGCCVSVAKPFVDDLSEGRSLAEMAAERGLWISVAQNARLSPTGKAVKRFVSSGQFGTAAFGNYYTYRNRMRDLPAYMREEPWPAINATSIHQFDLYRYLFEVDIASVCFRGCDAAWNPYRDPGVVMGWLELANGLVISYFQSFVSRIHLGPEHPYTHVMFQGSKGALFWGGPWEQNAIQFHREEDQAVIELPREQDDVTRETKEYCQLLLESLRGERDVFCDASDNLWSLAAVKAAEHSAAQGGLRVDVREYARSHGMG